VAQREEKERERGDGNLKGKKGWKKAGNGSSVLYGTSTGRLKES